MWRLQLTLGLLLSCIDLSSSRIWQIPLPDNLQECYSRVKDAQPDSFIGSLYTWLCEHTTVNATRPKTKLSDNDAYIIGLYEKAFGTSNRTGRQAASKCVRKEYRMLTSEERKRYHNAINTLKRDTSVRPNRYDAIAGIHTASISGTAHGGPGFLGWHRIFLFIYERALRQVDPRICLPYWDSTLESDLNNPLESLIWSAEYFGTARGPVRRGPFANWRLPNGTQLIRNVGVDGDLLNNQIINGILSRRRYEEVTSAAESGQQYSIELQHGTVHMFVGGMMANLNTAAYDPIFYMHHAFIDYIFEKFRDRLRSLQIDPSVYPKWSGKREHAANAPTYFSTHTQKDGYSELLANTVRYEPVPNCTASRPYCGPGSLVCNVTSGRCLPSIKQKKRTKRDTEESSDDLDVCEAKLPYAQPNQNDYCCDGSCDIDNWVMIPVRIVNMRPPNLQKYSSYPVNNGSVESDLDIYSPKRSKSLMTYVTDKQGNLKCYAKCEEDNSVGQIFLYSHGINYDGYYKESTIVDQKLSVSVSMGYVGVKKPADVRGGVSRALVRAHDACGRMCHVACLDKKQGEYRLCSGAIAVNNERPLMYGRQFDDAVL
ncbi:tyrosinase-like protein tyr-1, partial [Biomphalaria pfeifferi]